MKCPACREPDLVMSSRQSIEIDYCPQCRGVWLDRGELDKLIERSVQETGAAQAAPPPPPPAQPHGRPYRDDDHGRHYGDYDRGGYRKKKSFWHEIFD